jgi:hypothetical protein
MRGKRDNPKETDGSGRRLTNAPMRAPAADRPKADLAKANPVFPSRDQETCQLIVDKFPVKPSEDFRALEGGALSPPMSDSAARTAPGPPPLAAALPRPETYGLAPHLSALDVSENLWSGPCGTRRFGGGPGTGLPETAAGRSDGLNPDRNRRWASSGSAVDRGGFLTSYCRFMSRPIHSNSRRPRLRRPAIAINFRTAWLQIQDCL